MGALRHEKDVCYDKDEWFYTTGVWSYNRVWVVILAVLFVIFAALFAYLA